MEGLRELRHISRIKTIMIGLFAFLTLYTFAAFTPLSKHTPFFSWQLYTGLGREFKIFDILVYSGTKKYYLYQNISDINKRRNFQKLIEQGSLDKTYIESLIRQYVAQSFDKYEIVERKIPISQITNRYIPFIPLPLP